MTDDDAPGDAATEVDDEAADDLPLASQTPTAKAKAKAKAKAQAAAEVQTRVQATV